MNQHSLFFGNCISIYNMCVCSTSKLEKTLVSVAIDLFNNHFSVLTHTKCK